ncbi:hypothetical protein G3P88_004477 [Escherichia coli]|nr:hypothetical protein [Escherichia coli]EFE7536323.1 hypothetical protein [Escherichia coli]EFJ3961950.1 hypothetical protein [Escherichia coli]
MSGNHHINFFPACRRWYPGRVSKRSVPDGLIDIRAGCSHAAWNVRPYTLTASGRVQRSVKFVTTTVPEYLTKKHSAITSGRVHLFCGAGSTVAMYRSMPAQQ